VGGRLRLRVEVCVVSAIEGLRELTEFTGERVRGCKV
jgi:hypothetical protein